MTTRAPLPGVAYVRPVYYDVEKHWTEKIEPHLGDPELNAILVEDFGRFTWGPEAQGVPARDVPPRLRGLRLVALATGPLPFK